MTFSVMAERVRFAPQGLFGGGDGALEPLHPRPRRRRDPLPLEVQRRPRRRRGDEHPDARAAADTATSRCAIRRSSAADVEAGPDQPGRARWRLRRAVERPAEIRRAPSPGRPLERLSRRRRYRRHVHRRRARSTRRSGSRVDRQGAVDAGRSVGGLLPRARSRDGGRPGVEIADCRSVLHATTVATNAVITRTGGPAALISTEGFSDVLEIARQIRHDLYDLRTTKPVPLVPRRGRSRSGSGSGSTAPSSCRSTRSPSAARAARLRDSEHPGGRRVPPARLREPGPRGAGRRDPARRGARGRRSRFRARSRPRSGSTRARARPSRTPTSDRSLGRLHRSHRATVSRSAAPAPACG